jgi:hypothetical protein
MPEQPEQKQYSQKLIDYLGKTELEAFDEAKRLRDMSGAYDIFLNALHFLPDEELSRDEMKVAESILVKRIEQTKPWNVGSASSGGDNEE